MGAEDFKHQSQFERTVDIGTECAACWTNSYRYFKTDVRVVAVNQVSYQVEVVKTVDGYPAGWKLNIPKVTSLRRWTWNNRLIPPEEVPA